MSRLVVRNSTLVYPPVPDAILRPDDVILPLVDKFEETLFIAGPGYPALQALFPSFNLELRARARRIAEVLPPWLGEPIADHGHSAWDAYADNFAKFSLGPIAVSAFLAPYAASLQPAEVLAWELERTPEWWAGRQMVAEAAQAIGAACGAPVRLTASAAKRALRDQALPALRVAQAWRFTRELRSAPRDRPREPVDVLFVVSGPTTAPLYDRIAARLQADHGLRVAAVDTPHEGPTGRIAPGQRPRGNLYSFTEPAMARAALTEALAAAQQFADVADALAEHELYRELPAPLQGVLVRRLQGTMIADLPRSLYAARLWRRALDELQPRVLVGFNAYNVTLAPGILQARHRGIPTVMVQHGMFGPFFRAGALLPFDEVIVFDAYPRGLLSALAEPHTAFTETGHADYDDARPEPGLREAAAELRGELLGDRQHLVVVTTQPVELRLMANEERWWLDLLAEACAKDNALLAIKPHPEERASLPRYEALQERLPANVRLIRHGEVPLRTLIAASDLLVTRFSSTATEAALLGVPVIVVNLSGGPDQFPYAEEGAALGVYSPEGISPALNSLLRDTDVRSRLLASQQHFLERHLGPRDGRATERISARIEALAGGHRSMGGA